MVNVVHATEQDSKVILLQGIIMPARIVTRKSTNTMAMAYVENAAEAANVTTAVEMVTNRK
jgi:hypothetical protein